MTAAKNPRRPLGRNTLTDVATWNSSSFLSAVSTEPSASIKMLNLKLEAEVIAQYFWSCLSRPDMVVYNLTHLHEVNYGYATDAFQPTQTVLHWRRLSCNICTTKLCTNKPTVMGRSIVNVHLYHWIPCTALHNQMDNYMWQSACSCCGYHSSVLS